MCSDPLKACGQSRNSTFLVETSKECNLLISFGKTSGFGAVLTQFDVSVNRSQVLASDFRRNSKLMEQQQICDFRHHRTAHCYRSTTKSGNANFEKHLTRNVLGYVFLIHHQNSGRRATLIDINQHISMKLARVRAGQPRERDPDDRVLESRASFLTVNWKNR